MSNCFKELYDYGLIKKCSKCGKISLKSNFYKIKNRRDGLQPHCLSSREQHYVDNEN